MRQRALRTENSLPFHLYCALALNSQPGARPTLKKSISLLCCSGSQKDLPRLIRLLTAALTSQLLPALHGMHLCMKMLLLSPRFPRLLSFQTLLSFSEDVGGSSHPPAKGLLSKTPPSRWPCILLSRLRPISLELNTRKVIFFCLRGLMYVLCQTMKAT